MAPKGKRKAKVAVAVAPSAPRGKTGPKAKVAVAVNTSAASSKRKAKDEEEGVDEELLGQQIVEDANDESSGRGRKKLRRRDTDGAVERVIEVRLQGRFSEEAINGTTNKVGLSVREYISAGLRENRLSQSYLNTAFWTSFFQEFQLHSRVCDELPDPDGSERPRNELLGKLAHCHDKNPATRTCEPLCNYLNFCSKLNYCELYGLIIGCQETPIVTKSMYRKVMLALLQCIARFDWGVAVSRFMHLPMMHGWFSVLVSKAYCMHAPSCFPFSDVWLTVLC
jgi:hypothetical protein